MIKVIMRANEEGSITDEFRNTPVLKTAIRKITTDDERDFALRKFLNGNLKCICFTIEGNKNGGIHAVWRVSASVSEVGYHTCLICRALVPNMRARSYFVK